MIPFLLDCKPCFESTTYVIHPPKRDSYQTRGEKTKSFVSTEYLRGKILVGFQRRYPICSSNSSAYDCLWLRLPEFYPFSACLQLSFNFDIFVDMMWNVSSTFVITVLLMFILKCCLRKRNVEWESWSNISKFSFLTNNEFEPDMQR